MQALTYARFFPSDWRSGCIQLDLEEEGLYIRGCAFMYDTGQAIPGNDAVAARLMNVDIRRYRRVMESLIEKGKMIRAQGVIINERVLEEMDRYRRELAKRSEAAKKREADRKARLADEVGKIVKEHLQPKKIGETSPGLPADFSSKSPGPLPEQSRKSDKNVNKINETEAQSCQTRATKPEARSQKPDSSNPPPPSFGGPQNVRFTDDGRLECVNGYRDLWLEKFGDAEAFDLALIEVAPFIQRNGSAPLEARVSSALAKILRDKNDRDARYMRAAQTNAKKGAAPDPATDRKRINDQIRIKQEEMLRGRRA